MKKLLIHCENPNSFLIQADSEKSKAQNLMELKNIVLEFMLKGYTHLEIDLSGIRYPNSSLIGKILYLYHKSLELSGKIDIKNLSPEIKETFSLLKLNELLKL